MPVPRMISKLAVIDVSEDLLLDPIRLRLRQIAAGDRLL